MKRIKAFIGLFILCSCQVTTSSSSFDYKIVSGVYELLSATLDEIDIKSEFNLYNITLLEDKTMNVFLSRGGLINKRDSTYIVEENTLTETYHAETFLYEIDFDNKTLRNTIEEYGQTLVTVFKKKVNPDDIDKTVNFNDVLFGEDIDSVKKYNYAPSAIRTVEEGQEVMHVWYCTNISSAVIVDYIGYRKGILGLDNKWTFSEEEIVLGPTPDTWDGRHTCDPAVIMGNFNYNDVSYKYMMSYLGCTTEDYSNNETGLAVANNPAGPWLKLDHLNPIVPWSKNNFSGTWGTGMPSLLSVDKQGIVFLFYMDSKVGVGVEKWDFSDLNNPLQLLQTKLTHNGVYNHAGNKINLGYIDVAYDEVKDRLYLMSGTHEKDPPDGSRSLVNSHCVVVYLDGISNMNVLTNTLANMVYNWQTLDYVGPEETGWVRNHNPCLVTDPYGRVFDSNNLWTIVSTGLNTYPFDNIFTYRLKGYIFSV
ncbi:MAG: hypothetical protein LBM99_06420 [Bacillales bacterium]|jgi:hypothetical protein|nr:hypothetical protein [Bacillales bacterium]